MVSSTTEVMTSTMHALVDPTTDNELLDGADATCDHISTSNENDKHSSKELQPATGFFRDLHADHFIATFGVGELGTGFAGQEVTTPFAIGESPVPAGPLPATATTVSMPTVPLESFQSFLTPHAGKSQTYTGELFPLAATAMPAHKVEHQTLSFLQGPEPVILTTPLTSSSAPMSEASLQVQPVGNENEDEDVTDVVATKNLKKKVTAQKRKKTTKAKVTSKKKSAAVAITVNSASESKAIADPEATATDPLVVLSSPTAGEGDADTITLTAERPAARQRKPKKSPTEIAFRKQKRRSNHNAVERRRRDNINDRIAEIETLLIGNHYEFGHIDERSGKASASGPSKGETLHKASMHLRFLRHKEQLMEQAMMTQHEMLTRMAQQCRSLQEKVQENGNATPTTGDVDMETIPDVYTTIKAIDDASKGMAEMDAVTKMSVMGDGDVAFDYDEQRQLEDELERQQLELTQPVDLVPAQ